MTLKDGTPRRPYDGPRDAYGRRPAWSLNWKVVALILVAVAVLALLTSSFDSGPKRSVDNAPAAPPPSVQAPDTTPPVNQNPSE